MTSSYTSRRRNMKAVASPAVKNRTYKWSASLMCIEAQLLQLRCIFLELYAASLIIITKSGVMQRGILNWIRNETISSTIKPTVAVKLHRLPVGQVNNLQWRQQPAVWTSKANVNRCDVPKRGATVDLGCFDSVLNKVTPYEVTELKNDARHGKHLDAFKRSFD